MSVPFMRHTVSPVVATSTTGHIECKAAYLRAWRLIREQGITATQFVEFLRPLADLDGLVVSHFVQPAATPACAAQTVAAGQLVVEQTERLLSFGLNADGGIFVESTLMELH